MIRNPLETGPRILLSQGEVLAPFYITQNTYWKALGQPWRTEPEIPAERQAELAQCRTIVVNIKKGLYPFKRMKLNRADVEWLLATHENGQGPVDWSDERQRGRRGLDLRGAHLHQINLSGLPLACIYGGLGWFAGGESWFTRDSFVISETYPTTKEQREAARVGLSGANLYKIHLEGADLRNTSLKGANLEGAHLEGAHLEDANLSRASLREVHLEDAYLEGARLEEAHLEGAHLEDAHLEDIHLEGAHLEAAYLNGVHLEGAHLEGAHLEAAYLNGAHLEGAILCEAHLEGTTLCEAFFDGATQFDDIILGDEEYGTVSLADVHWGGANITVINWAAVTVLGDEHKALQSKLLFGDQKPTEYSNRSRKGVLVLGGRGLDEDTRRLISRANSEVTRLDQYRKAARVNHQLAVLLQGQGLNEDAARFAYQAQRLQRKVLGLQVLVSRQGNFAVALSQAHDARPIHQTTRRRYSTQPLPLISYRNLPKVSLKQYIWNLILRDRDLWWRLQKLGPYLFSWFLDILAGYGYKLRRSFFAYLLVITGFATAYYLLGHTVGPPLSPLGAFVFSVTSFHGRGFFPGGIQLDDPLTVFAAFEAFVGLIIEATFIATLTQRFFKR